MIRKLENQGVCTSMRLHQPIFSLISIYLGSMVMDECDASRQHNTDVSRCATGDETVGVRSHDSAAVLSMKCWTRGWRNLVVDLSVFQAKHTPAIRTTAVANSTSLMEILGDLMFKTVRRFTESGHWREKRTFSDNSILLLPAGKSRRTVWNHRSEE